MNLQIYIYFQKHGFKYCFGNEVVLHSVKFLSSHQEKKSGGPASASEHSVPANEAIDLLGAEISKAADKSKKSRQRDC